MAGEPLLSPADLAALRADHQLTMRDTVTIRKPGTGWVYDPVTDTEWPAPGVVVYAGPGRVQSANRAASTVQAGTQTVTVGDMVGAVPYTVTEMAPDQTITVDVSDDPGLQGRTFVIATVEASTFATARHFYATSNLG